MENNNNMACDLATGVCGTTDNDELELITFTQPKKNNHSLLRDGPYLLPLLGARACPAPFY